MTTIQSHTRWVARMLMAIACMATWTLLSVTAVQARTPQASPVASSSSTTSNTVPGATTARAARARTLAPLTRALNTCERIHPHHCAAAKRAVAAAKRTVEHAARKLATTRARPASFSDATTRYDLTVGGKTPVKEVSTPALETPTPAKESPTPAKEIPPPTKEIPTPTIEAPTPAKESPAQGSTTFQPGINSGSAAIWELPGAELLGAKVVRVAASIATTPEELEPVIAAYAEQGIRVAPLATFTGTLPTPAQAQDLAAWANAFGPGGTFWSSHAGGQYAIQTIEFGNETSDSYQYTNNTPAGYASRAQTYALRFAEAATAIRAVNPKVGLLALGDSGNAGPAWVENMFKAVPNLGTLVAGWTVHPYGPNWRAKFEEIVSQTAAQGAPSTIPIDVTEWGLSTDNGRCLSENYGWNPCMTYQEAAEVLARTIGEMRQALPGRLGLLLLYQIRDQKPSGETTGREDYFGAVQRELQPKGAYTTKVKEVLAGS
ncbi:MAG TPA: hypothetical protein VG147_02445 [Solirubrobacteraceae bacterium]|jgi:hypothetical protein|nr:hypothetical protein [Solirubrobacteraceae bacterium]